MQNLHRYTQGGQCIPQNRSALKGHSIAQHPIHCLTLFDLRVTLPHVGSARLTLHDAYHGN